MREFGMTLAGTIKFEAISSQSTVKLSKPKSSRNSSVEAFVATLAAVGVALDDGYQAAAMFSGEGVCVRGRASLPRVFGLPSWA